MHYKDKTKLETRNSNSASSIAKIFDIDNKEGKLKYRHGPPLNELLLLIISNECNQGDGTRKRLRERCPHSKEKQEMKVYLFKKTEIKKEG